MRRWLCLLVSNGRVTLDGLMFDTPPPPICGHACIFEVQGVFLLTHILFCCNTCSSQMGRILVYRTNSHEELDGVV